MVVWWGETCWDRKQTSREPIIYGRSCGWLFFLLHRLRKWISVVRLDAVFYGPVGGAHCLLKWCFNVPAVTMAVVYTKHGAFGRGRESWRRGSRRRTRGGRRDTDVWTCFARCKRQEINYQSRVREDHSADSESLFSPPSQLASSWSCWKRGGVSSYINFKASSGFSTVEFGKDCLCW